MVIDLTPQNLTGKQVQHLLEEIGVTANKNTIPNDPRSPFVTSGIRLGTPALTTRGFDEEAMRTLGKVIAEAIQEQAKTDTVDPSPYCQRLQALANQFPLYPELAELLKEPVA